VIDTGAHRPCDSPSTVVEQKAIKAVEKEDMPETVEEVMTDLGSIEIEGERSSSLCAEDAGDHGKMAGGI